jgi:glucose/arabinose dehydrogenase
MVVRGDGVSSRVAALATWVVLLSLVSAFGLGDVGQSVGRPELASAAPLPVPIAGPVSGPLAAPDNSIVLQPFLSGLSAPIFITHAGDGSGRQFVVEKGGRIKVVRNGQVNQTPFLDLSSLVSGGSEQGLLGLAFHPGYEVNGRFFVFYTALPPPQPTTNVGSNILAEYRALNPGADVADPNDPTPDPERTLFSLHDRFGNHNGGMLAFGQDGYLYVGTGDEGSGGDPDENAQNVTSLFGKLLRLDVDTNNHPAPPGFNYSIPPDNPFFGQTSPPGIRQEIFALGLRNPWRWSFDRQTRDIFIGDVGQGSWEEIDRLPHDPTDPPALNFGWDIREGAHCHEPSTNCSTGGLTDPILEYSRASNGTGCASVTGGYRYRGTQHPALQGIYFYADFCSGRIWKGILQSGNWTAVEALDTAHSISSFGEDENGELFVVAFGGSVFRLVSVAQVCAPRPNVALQTTRTGPGLLTVVVAATDNPSTPNNELQAVAFTGITNAFVTIGSQVDRQSPFTVTLPGVTRTTSFSVRRRQAGQAMHVNLTVTDRCGPWPTFVGAGVGVP